MSDFYFKDEDALGGVQSVHGLAKNFPSHVFTSGPITDLTVDWNSNIVTITCAVSSKFTDVKGHSYGGIHQLADKNAAVRKTLQTKVGKTGLVWSDVSGEVTVVEEIDTDINAGDFPGMNIDFGTADFSASEHPADRKMMMNVPLSLFEPTLMSAITAVWAVQLGTQLTKLSLKVSG
jgi:hypothetical protein